MTERKQEMEAIVRELLDQAEALIRKAHLLRMKAGRPKGDDRPVPVDFNVLPGRTARARADALYTGRRIRDELFPHDLFGELAWDILLELFLAHPSDEGLSVDAICGFAPSFRNTVDRYLSMMEEQGLLECDPPVERGRTRRVALGPRSRQLMARFFAMTDGQVPARNVQRSLLRLVSKNPSES